MNWSFSKLFDFHQIARFKGPSNDPQRIITEDMRAAAEVATRQWNDYQTRFVPFEKKFINDITRDEGAKQSTVRGMVGADVAQKTANAQMPGGVDPSTSLFANAQGRRAVGGALGAGYTDATQAVIDNKAQGLQTAVSLGRGQQTEALNGMVDMANISGQVALNKALTDSKIATANRGATMSAIGSMVGMAGAGASNYLQGMGSAGRVGDTGALSNYDVYAGAGSKGGPAGSYYVDGRGNIKWN